MKVEISYLWDIANGISKRLHNDLEKEVLEKIYANIEKFDSITNITPLELIDLIRKGKISVYIFEDEKYVDLDEFLAILEDDKIFSSDKGFLTVKKLKEILNRLPDDFEVYDAYEVVVEMIGKTIFIGSGD